MKSTPINRKALKQARGLRSTEEVAVAIGVSRQAIWQFETGISSPSLRVLIRLANLYGVKLDTLIQPIASGKAA